MCYLFLSIENITLFIACNLNIYTFQIIQFNYYSLYFNYFIILSISIYTVLYSKAHYMNYIYCKQILINEWYNNERDIYFYLFSSRLLSYLRRSLAHTLKKSMQNK